MAGRPFKSKCECVSLVVRIVSQKRAFAGCPYKQACKRIHLCNGHFF